MVTCDYCGWEGEEAWRHDLEACRDTLRGQVRELRSRKEAMGHATRCQECGTVWANGKGVDHLLELRARIAELEEQITIGESQLKSAKLDAHRNLEEIKILSKEAAGYLRRLESERMAVARLEEERDRWKEHAKWHANHHTPPK